ncbi:uncharacterized protein PFL1_05958 [Pseudozyma flocculosa PF-1]|uniref:PIN domain-containing protein n=2 Tax=Pseudozyma flocculosa TaxID=84751 RepID=A0A5C3F3V8_9BASI|nr:uncharacterized protein PFL1_05958 [Pseudozyma flocculosa PF-1]EPQ26637.1 hypothetical protein PFL1_05958 [Pseudozyma flocculosa PF-1]SPO38367.1 uncharacterized protein PSFLO_03844 [Pseudozyma flocculosa]
MPSYADVLDQMVRNGATPGPSNPLGLSMRTGDGDLLMLDHDSTRAQTHQPPLDEVDMIDLELQPASSSADAAPPGAPKAQEAWREDLARLRNVDAVPKSLWVLDTNVLLSSLDLLQPLADHIIEQNVASLLDPTGTLPPSPIALVIPYRVITELDAQKTSTRETTRLPSPGSHGRSTTHRLSSLAREASRWILTTLKAQKNLQIPLAHDHHLPLPQSHRALYGQTHSHHNHTRPRGRCTNDQEIVAFCKRLDDDVGGVVFVTDDRDAAITAELEEVESLQIRDIVDALVHGRGQDGKQDDGNGRRGWKECVPELVDQWVYQMGGAPSMPPAVAAAAAAVHPEVVTAAIPVPEPIDEVQMHVEEPDPVTVPTPPPPIPPSPVQPVSVANKRSPRLSPDGRTTSDSMHAPMAKRRSPPSYPTAAHQRRPDPVQKEGEDDKGQLLNPHIDWEALVGAGGKRSNGERRRW